MSDKIQKSDAEWRAKLSEQQFEVTRRAGTEPAFTGVYCDTKDAGTYKCVCCGSSLFDSETKFDSGTGWPSFTEPLSRESVELREDRAHGMLRIEVVCSHCDAHLGHVFPDGPAPGGQRYCMNSASLELEPQESAETELGKK